MDLEKLGWNEQWQGLYEAHRTEGVIPGRLAVSYGALCTVWTSAGEYHAAAAGRLRLEGTEGRVGLPAVGDWVTVRPPIPGTTGQALIVSILPRKSAFIRKEPGLRTREQVVAANVDTVFLVTSMNREFNPRRLERYLALALESGAQPVIVLNKCDLAPRHIKDFLELAAELGPQVPVHAVSAINGDGLEQLQQYFQGHRTSAMLGSSGVGKSTLINHWLGEERLRTNPVRAEDDRGRHTTTHRELIVLRDGGLVIDTPGMRELQLWEAEEGIEESFEEIHHLGSNCRFRDCQHQEEPGCAVQAAIERGELNPLRLQSYHHLQEESRQNLQRREDLARRQSRRPPSAPRSSRKKKG